MDILSGFHEFLMEKYLLKFISVEVLKNNVGKYRYIWIIQWDDFHDCKELIRVATHFNACVYYVTSFVFIIYLRDYY